MTSDLKRSFNYTSVILLTVTGLIYTQSIRSGKRLNSFEVVGHSGASAQMMFLGHPTKVYIIDKVENNELKLDGLPVWGTSYDTETNVATPMKINSNTFCAGGNVLGNGTWLNVGGNQGVSYGGLNIVNNIDPYKNKDGGKSIRLLNPCDDNSCGWTETTAMTTRRWYPTLETLEDGSIIIIGGDDWGGYVNDKGQNNPTYEFFPSKGDVIGLNLLTTTLPANLYPLTWLLPSGNLFINANLGNAILNYKSNTEYALANVPHAVRTYPGSAANAMLPLTPANNWTATILFCGGSNLQPDQWVLNWNIAAYPADATCVKITPDVDTAWKDDDSMPEGRSMGNFIFLPDGRLFLLNGISKGTAGYGNTSWAIGQSFGDGPLFQPAYYDPYAPSGSKWSRPSDLQPSTVARMYHSVALLLPDGSIMSSGSNPNADYVPPGTAGYPYFTEYKVERFYPDYYNKPRPQPSGIPKSIGYGGAFFDIKLTKDDSGFLEQTKVVIIRPGFSTHAINMGQRYVQLSSTYETNTDGSSTLHVSQLPPNPSILAPGPAYLYVIVHGVPSIGQMVMIGNGQLGNQPVSTDSQALPGTVPQIVKATESAGEAGSVTGGRASARKSTSSRTELKPFHIIMGTLISWSFGYIFSL
ncbi:copper radical oxidase [Phakopsora pachyrhizi]|nr:copper radical oxidase [Phakopsora pachyrhizi]